MIRTSVFLEAKSNIDRILNSIDSTEEKIAFLTFAIKAIGRELVASATTNILYGLEIDDSIVDNIPVDFRSAHLVKKNTGRENIQMLKGINVLTAPWNEDRLVSAVFDIFKEGFQPEKGNYEIYLFPEIYFAVVINGRHHLAAADIARQISVNELHVIELKQYFKTISACGDTWFRIDPITGSRSLICTIGDPRFGIIYELAAQIEALKELND